MFLRRWTYSQKIWKVRPLLNKIKIGTINIKLSRLHRLNRYKTWAIILSLKCLISFQMNNIFTTKIPLIFLLMSTKMEALQWKDLHLQIKDANQLLNTQLVKRIYGLKMDFKHKLSKVTAKRTKSKI